MRYVFDIDGTICFKTEDQSYEDSLPYIKRIEYINKLFNEGHTITFNTARGMGSSNNTEPNKWHSLTLQQLKEWGVKYHNLFMGKPAGDLYIDDKGIKDEEFFRN